MILNLIVRYIAGYTLLDHIMLGLGAGLKIFSSEASDAVLLHYDFYRLGRKRRWILRQINRDLKAEGKPVIE